MSMLAFFPWLETQKLKIEDYALIPYERGKQPGGILQSQIDTVLLPYMNGTNPVVKATLLQLEGKELTQDLSEDERIEMFEFAELLAFAGLASRQYFNSLFGYTNRDASTLIIQGFSEASGGAAVTTRRRDGSSMNYLTGGVYLVPRPLHVPSNPTELDLPFLKALLDARELPQWNLFEEGIFFFNRANTDNEQVTEQWEVIAISGAFERIFDCRAGKENDLATRFMAIFSPERWLTRDSCPRISEERIRGRRIAEIWIRDFFQLRGNLGHGKKKSEQPQIWSNLEHLLLSSYLFPLLVKRLIADEKLYAWTEDDQIDIDVFEKLTCSNLFEEIEDDNSVQTWPWLKIRSEAKFAHGINEAVAELIEEQKKRDGADTKPEV